MLSIKVPTPAVKVYPLYGCLLRSALYWPRAYKHVFLLLKLILMIDYIKFIIKVNTIIIHLFINVPILRQSILFNFKASRILRNEVC